MFSENVWDFAYQVNNSSLAEIKASGASGYCNACVWLMFSISEHIQCLAYQRSELGIMIAFMHTS